MALPKKKRPKSRVGSRQASYRLLAPALNPCPQCHSARRPHRVCLVCGYYRGRVVIAKEEVTEQR